MSVTPLYWHWYAFEQPGNLSVSSVFVKFATGWVGLLVFKQLQIYDGANPDHPIGVLDEVS